MGAGLKNECIEFIFYNTGTNAFILTRTLPELIFFASYCANWISFSTIYIYFLHKFISLPKHSSAKILIDLM